MFCLTLLLAASALNHLPFRPVGERFTLIRARQEVQAELVWNKTDAQGHGLTGQGVVICDVDSSPDIFHPMFFKADRGRFSWIDVDGDGHWSPGDAVDIDGNGVAGPGETLAWLPCKGEAPAGRDTTRFQAGYDFLYQDANGNGVRDFGPPAFTESDPCYGEGIFLVDDVNANEQLDVGESLVGLKTSKIRAIGGYGHVYRRGVDLIEAGRYGEEHGTLVCGVLAGGWPGLHHLTGIAPDAELLSTPYDMKFAQDEGADVVLFEYAYEFSDGSNDLDQQVNELARAGICFVAPAGNDRAPGRHVVFSDSETVTLTNRDPRGPFLEFAWRGTGPSLIRVAPPGAPPCDLPTESGQVQADCLRNSYLEREETPRGTSFMHMGARTTTNVGTWTFSFPGSSSPIHGFVFYDFDDPGAEWAGGDGGYTVASPGTADSAITVAAYENYHPGDVAWFSGEGPRLDGRPDVDIAAPGVRVLSTMVGGSFLSFSGTSAAIPFVAAGAALLRQAFPGMNSGRLRSLLANGAAHDSLTGNTNRWGAGKLRINASLVYGLQHPNAVGADLAVSVSPNPSRRSMEISWTSNGDAGAEVRIFSVQGALVWETSVGPAAGVLRVPWPGVNRQGRHVPAGIYFAHVKQEGAVGVARCVMVK